MYTYKTHHDVSWFLGLFEAVWVEDTDKLLSCWQGHLQTDDRSHWKQDLHQELDHCTLQTIPRTLDEPVGQFLRRGDVWIICTDVHEYTQ